MNDFLTEKNKKAGVLGKLKWVLCGFCILLSLGAIGASEKYIGEASVSLHPAEAMHPLTDHNNKPHCLLLHNNVLL